MNEHDEPTYPEDVPEEVKLAHYTKERVRYATLSDVGEVKKMTAEIHAVVLGAMGTDGDYRPGLVSRVKYLEDALGSAKRIGWGVICFLAAQFSLSCLNYYQNHIIGHLGQ